MFQVFTVFLTQPSSTSTYTSITTLNANYIVRKPFLVAKAMALACLRLQWSLWRFGELRADSEYEEENALEREVKPVYMALTERVIWLFTTILLGAYIILSNNQYGESSCQAPKSYSFETGFQTDLAAATAEIALEQRIFTGGLERDDYGNLVMNQDGVTKQFVGDPSDIIDSNWMELEKAIELVLNDTEARTQDGKRIFTMPEPGRNGWYRASIDVIHSLHCVNQLRKAVYADHYFANRGQFYHLHMNHCVEHLRQSIQCSADLTPLTYAYDEQSGIGTPIWTNKHTCRDFSRILSWDQPKAKLPLAHPQLDV